MLWNARLLPVLCTSGLLFSACPNPEKTQAPDDLVGLAKHLWQVQRDVPDADLEEALLNLEPVIRDLTQGENNNGDLVIKPAVGPLPVLTDDEIAWTELDNDPSEAPGLFLANQYDCDIETLQEILTAPNQGDLHTGVYDSYDRDYEQNRGDFLDGEGDRLLWQTSYSATPTVTQYSATTSSGVRRAVLEGDDFSGPFAIIQGTVLREPADFGDAADDHFFTQDYQLEVFYPRDGRIHHFYGMWRQMQVGSFGVHDEIFINFTLDALIQWDKQNEDLCATWPELP